MRCTQKTRTNRINACALLTQKDGEEEMKREPNVRMVPDGMSTCSSNNTLEIDLDSSESQNLEAVSIDSIADVGKSCQELTAASADQR